MHVNFDGSSVQSNSQLRKFRRPKRSNKQSKISQLRPSSRQTNLNELEIEILKKNTMEITEKKTPE